MSNKILKPLSLPVLAPKKNFSHHYGESDIKVWNFEDEKIAHQRGSTIGILYTLFVTFRNWVEPECPIRVRPLWYLAKVELRGVPAADAVVSAKVSLVCSESVSCSLVPLGEHVHIIALLVAQPRYVVSATLHCYIAFTQEIFQHLLDRAGFFRVRPFLDYQSNGK